MSSKQINGQSNGHVSETTFPLEELSWSITKNASIVSQYLRGNHLPQPSFDSDGPSTVIPGDAPQNIHQARQALIAAALEISQLAIGPSEFLPNLATGFQYISCLAWLCQYNIFHLVPQNSTISYAALASAAGIPEQRAKSIIRMAMTNGLFREKSDGKHVSHSATSALLARNDDIYAYATYMCSKSAPMAMQLAAAHKKWGADTTNTHETAYNVAFNTDLSFFDHLGRDKARMGEFAAYMRNVRSSEAVDVKHLVTGFKWQSIPEGGLLVDVSGRTVKIVARETVGGSTGTSAIALAKAFPHLSFVVQDLPANAESGRKAAESLPEDISSRITFQGHNFMDPEPVQGADAYLLRMILHDWPDNEAVIILRNIVAAMGNNSKSRLLIMDTVLPKPGSVPISVERIVRARDLTMLQAFNSKERDLEDWKDLLAATNPKLKLVGVAQPFGSAMSVLEISLDS
ncbi:sterigmatocystin 8-O-methyltransferase [Delitschia confertaspora ATCC 74209]|uniref:Sterigmatocystin 8-O-methyltransferase n=1 Tax=Delitschia confertaspora ATCC 74209 TaxID=1513339 RepID=A0A9P4JRK7_9PLEO|nr:sterigmatocystin 8-O-methyltransferase [Delitschia confertaspora ATCC 74209]